MNLLSGFCGLAALGLLAASAQGDCLQWLQRTDVGSPGSRTSATLAFDSVHGVTVMFGGETTNGGGVHINPTDTWEYNGTNWYLVTITGASPPGRSYQAMAFDSARGVVMLCGGQNAGGILNDAWFYTSGGDGTGTWTQGAAFDATGRTGLAMAFDSRRSVMVVMGGLSDLNATSDEPNGTLEPTTFEWDGMSWSLGSPFPGVFRTDLTGIARHAMCFDANMGQVVMGGGIVPSYSVAPASPCNGPFFEVPANLVEGYGLNLQGWTEIDDAKVTDCGGFSQSAMAYDSRRHVSVLFGGSSLTGNAPQTQEFPAISSPGSPGANIWYDRGLIGPSQRSRHGMAYDSRRGVVVLFGGENANGLQSDTWELTPDVPTITYSPQNQEACEGSSAQVFAYVTGVNGPFGYQWQHNGVNVTNDSRISGATNGTTLTISALTTNDSGAYVLVLYDSCGDTFYGEPANLMVTYPATVTGITPNSLAMCPGDSGSLSVAYTSPLPVNYLWQFNGTALTEQTNQQLNFVAAGTNQSGLYSVIVSDSCGSVTSGVVPVSVGVWLRTPPPATNSAMLCQPFSIAMTARGKGNVTAQWFRNGTLIVPDTRVSSTSVLQASGDTLLTLSFSEVMYQDDGTYAATITDDCGPVNVGPFGMDALPDPPWIVIGTNGPVARWDAAMAYDSVRRVSVLFGGETSQATGPVLGSDTWEFDGTNWAQRLPATSPGQRTQAQMVYDSHRQRTVLFGGETTGLIYAPQTWEWDGNNWAQITTAHVPDFTSQPAFTYAACFDSARNEMLVFGGVTGPGYVSELWAYDGTDWTLKSSGGTGPVYRALCSTMAFDAKRGVAVLVGAAQSAPGAGNSYGNSVWEWDGAAWNERAQSGQLPSLGDNGNQFVYDTFRQECVLYGYEFGDTGGIMYPDPQELRLIWRWNGAQWKADPPTPTPGVLWHLDHSMVFDSARNELVVFGGIQDDGVPDTNFTYVMPYQDDPAVIEQPTVQVSLLGDEVQLSVVAAGAPPISYQWQKNGVNLTDGGTISGSQTNALTIDPTAIGDSGKYQLVLSNICGTAASQPIQLTLATTPLSVVLSGSSLSISWSGPMAELQSAPSPTGPWTTISGATSPFSVNPSGAMEFYRLFVP